MRLFVGIPLADAVIRELSRVAARLRDGKPGARAGGLRWTEPESWHITLQFLGNTTAEQFESLQARLGEVRSAPVAVELGELGFFDRVGVFFADVVVTPELAALQQRVAAATARSGFAAETRPFHPHITLAREAGNKKSREQGSGGARKQGNPLRELKARAGAQPRFTRFTAREFLLYESHLGREGARYEIRQRIALHGE